MKRWLSTGLLVVLIPVSSYAAPPDPVRELADAAYPRLSELAAILTLAEWATRADEIVDAAPAAAGAPAWKAGDPHWEAAKAKFLSHMHDWIADLIAKPQAKEIVRERFAKALNPVQAGLIKTALEADTTKGMPTWQDAVHLSVAFVGKHSELKIGSPEFSQAYKAWLKEIGIDLEMPQYTPELATALGSGEGRKYDMARGAAMNALAVGVDGQIKLRVFDLQKAIADEMDVEAKACAGGHK